MQLVDMLFDEIEDAKKRRVPFIIPIGTIEYHAHHASCGCDTMVINGTMRELEKSKEIVVCPPIWYGVASYAVGGPETGTIQVDVDVYEQYIYCILKSMLYGGNKNIYCTSSDRRSRADANDNCLPQSSQEADYGVYGRYSRKRLVGKQ